jgi:hypothetical protein
MTREKLFSVTKKDFRVDTFRSGGKGGQNQNKRDSGVRITHIDSGAVGESREEKSQLQNKKKALNKLIETKDWKIWFNNRVMLELGREPIEDVVDRQMKELKYESKENGRWKEMV